MKKVRKPIDFRKPIEVKRDAIVSISIHDPEEKPPPEFTDQELYCIAWMVGSIAWMPDRWTTTISSVAKKIRAYCGDEAVSCDAKPPTK